MFCSRLKALHKKIRLKCLVTLDVCMEWRRRITSIKYFISPNIPDIPSSKIRNQPLKVAWRIDLILLLWCQKKAYVKNCKKDVKKYRLSTTFSQGKFEMKQIPSYLLIVYFYDHAIWSTRKPLLAFTVPWEKSINAQIGISFQDGFSKSNFKNFHER